MSLHLSSPDQAQLSAALRILASPLDARSASEWRTEVLRTLQPLFGADSGAFVLSTANESSDSSLLHLPEDFLSDYVRNQHLDEAGGYTAGKATAFTTETLSRGDRRNYTDSAIYSAVFKHYDIEDAVGVVLERAERPPIVQYGKVFSPAGVPLKGVLALYGSQVGRRRFRREGFALMEILLPVIQSAGRTWLDLADKRQEMVRMIDRLADGVAVFTSSGTLTHRNPALTRMLKEDDFGASTLESAVEEMGRGALAYRKEPSSLPLAATFTREVRSPSNWYTLQCTSAESTMGLPGSVFVYVRPLTRKLPEGVELQRQFSLTPAEARVAAQIAQGASSKGIAANLNLSVHTVRRHAERIREKLNARTQSEIASKILRRDEVSL